MSDTSLCKKFEIYFSENAKDFNQEDDIHQDAFGTKFVNLIKFLDIVNCETSDKFCKKKVNGEDYVSISSCIDLLKNLKSFEGIKFGIALGFYGIKKYKNYKLPFVKDKDIDIRPQSLFEYSINDLIHNHYPDITVLREINMLQKHSIPSIKYKDNLFRVDVLLEGCDILIEYDEEHHDKPDIKQKDKIKDILYNYLGYDVLRCSKKNFSERNILVFLENLEDQIKENLLRDEPKNFKEYILHFFKKEYRDVDEKIIKLLTEEVCDDIINGLDIDEIGREIRSLSLNNIILPWLDLDYDDENSKAEVNKIITLIEDCEEPFQKKGNDYILSSRAFDLVIMSLDETLYVKTKIIKRVLQKMKIHFQKYLYDNNLKNLKDKKERRAYIPEVMDIGVEAGKLENIYKIKDMQKRISKLEAENEELKFVMKNIHLPSNGRGTIRENLISIGDLTDGKPIVPEIPQLVYCSESEYVIDDDKLKAKYNINKMKYKIKKSYTQVINDINKKLGISHCENDSITRDIILHAMYIEDYKIKYEKKKELISTSSDSFSINSLEEGSNSDFDLSSDNDSDAEDLLNVI